jgi:predicted metal-dependent enzyme (double-stranded beta helix superfamily)
MGLFEESFGIVDHIHALRTAFQPDEDASLFDNKQVENVLQDLVKDKQVLLRVVERLAHDIHFVREQSANMFNNEVVLWREPDGNFSVRMFIWAPGADSFIHDHNSWGMLTSWAGQVLVENYTRDDSVKEDARAGLKLKEKITVDPGKMVLIKPYNQGIHRVDRAADKFAINLSIYGKPGDRGYINKFDHQTDSVVKVVHRSRRRREWAKMILDHLGG